MDNEQTTKVTPDCPNCGSGWVIFRIVSKSWVCRKCGNQFSIEPVAPGSEPEDEQARR